MNNEEKINLLLNDLNKLLDSHGVKLRVSSKLEIGPFLSDLPVGYVDIIDSKTNQYVGKLMEEKSY